MKTKGLEEFVRYIKDRAYDLNARLGYHALVSVFFTKDGQRTTVLLYKDRKSLSNIGELVLYKKPDMVEVRISYNDKNETHNYSLTGFNEKNNENFPVVTKNNENNSLEGFGDFNKNSIESIVNKRLEQERKDRELHELKTKINENNETLIRKDEEIEGQRVEIEQLQEQIETLNKIVESKKNFKYYAGLTGDILQSFGIKKEIIAKPLAGLLAGSEETRAIEQNSRVPDDGSGIVEEKSTVSRENEKRAEMIALILEYLGQIDNQTLENIFSIFSEIENNPDNSDRILEFLNNNNQ